MKRCVWLFGFVVALVGCKGKPAVSNHSDVAQQPVASTASPSSATTPAMPSVVTPSTSPHVSSKGGPEWGWKQYDEESFETQPSHGRVFSVPENATRLRVKLTASLPVDGAAMTRQVFKSAKGVVREDRLIRLPCASIGVRADEATCALNASDSVLYVVRDRRALSGDPAAMALLRQKAGGGLLAVLPADKIHVALSVWACLANCAPLGGPAQ